MSKKAAVAKFYTDYGMIIILLLLVVYFSSVTISTQYPEGTTAAKSLTKKLENQAGRRDHILIITQKSPEDLRFAEHLDVLLSEKGYQNIETFSGDPPAIRRHLDSLGQAGQSIDYIATGWRNNPVVSRIADGISAYREVDIVVPSGYTWPTFLLTDNLLNIANQIAVIAIVAVGMTMVIITGGIDLSVGSLVALSAVLAAWFIRAFSGTEASTGSMILASLIAIALCAGVGGFSGFMINTFKLPPFIATLAMMQVTSGFAYIISQGEPIYEIPDSFVWLGRGATGLFSLPHAVVLMVLIYLAAHVLMSKTVLGRYIYAVGGNAEAARLSGIRVGWVLLFVYITSGAMAGVGGVVMASQLKSGAPTYGLMYELYVIAAVVVGGASLSGGQGRIFGTLIGAFIIAVIQNGMNLTNVESYTQKVVLGFVILGAVLLDMLKKRDWRGLWNLKKK